MFKLYWILDPNASEGLGGLALSPAPGKPKDAYSTHDPARALIDDLGSIFEQSIQTIVTLQGQDELAWLGTSDLPNVANSLGIKSYLFPLGDMGVPKSVADVDHFLDGLLRDFRNGKSILIHCNAGLGRAGTLGACFLLKTGTVKKSEEAISMIRLKRSGQAIQNYDQEEFVKEYAEFLRRMRKY